VDPPELPQPPKGALRFVCLSDTHRKHDQIDVPDGDILIHGELSINSLLLSTTNDSIFVNISYYDVLLTNITANSW